MATIEARKRKSGIRYTARIIIRRAGKIVHRESEIFSKKSLAKVWADRREAELAVPGSLEKLRHAGVPIKQVLEWYVEDYEGRTKFGRSELSHINQMINDPGLSELDALPRASGQLITHVRRRSKAGGFTQCGQGCFHSAVGEGGDVTAFAIRSCFA